MPTAIQVGSTFNNNFGIGEAAASLQAALDHMAPSTRPFQCAKPEPSRSFFALFYLYQV